MSTKSPEPVSGDEILGLVVEQVRLGPRVPGTEAHDALAHQLEDRLRESRADVTVQRFDVDFRGRKLPCRNLVGVFRAGRQRAGPPLLLCTHYDTRIQADRETDERLRGRPIPGANDGGSGTAVLLHMLPRLSRERLPRDVAVAFVDAEDLGNIDGKEFSLGADELAEHPVDGFAPGEVIALDMVGGTDMVLDIDAHILHHESSRRVTSDLFRIGGAMRWRPFVGEKPQRLKYIVSDHAPFLRRGIAAAILIDIDYPQWHTQADLPRAMSGASLAVSEQALWLYLSPPRS